MNCVVLKFGGTSLGNNKKVRMLSDLIIDKLKVNKKIIVVVSAMAGSTDELINKTQVYKNCKFNSEYDTVISSGEQVSAGLMSLLLNSKNINARSVMGWQIPIVTDSMSGKAKILNINTENIKNFFKVHDVLVVAGFQGIDSKQRITTLGRGGSDTSAVALAVAVGASFCEIYTDVDGIFTADPRIIKKAKKISKISYEEILEMTSLGSKVLHPRSVELAMKYAMKVYVKNSFSKNLGTLVTQEEKTMEKELISGISSTDDESKITLIGIPDTPGVASKIFSPLSKSNINVDMIVQNITEDGKFTNLTFTVHNSERMRAVNALKNSNLKFKKIHVDKNICKVSIIGVGMRSNVGVAEKMFEALAKNNVNIKVISTSEIKISVLIDLNKKLVALKSLHKVYGLDRKIVKKK